MVRKGARRSPTPPASPTSSRYELLLALGRAQVCAGHKEARTSLFRAYRFARDRGDATHAAEAVLSLNRGFFARTGDTDVEAVEALEETLALFADDDDGGTKAALLAALASELVWAESGDRRFDAERPRARDGPPRGRSAVRSPACSCLRNMTILAPDTLSERTANCYELLGLAEEVQDDTIRFDAAFHRGGTALEAGDAEAANDMVELAARVAGSLRQPRFLWQARLMQTAQAVFRGSLDDAEFFADEALDLGRRAGQGARCVRVPHRADARDRTVAGPELAEHVEELRPFAGQPAGTSATCSPATSTRPASDGASEHLPRSRQQPLPSAAARHARSSRALQPGAPRDTRRRSGDGGGALRALQPFADAFANTTVAKPVGWHYLGMLAATTGQIVDAESDLRKAIAIHDIVGAPLFRAESEVELARVLLERRPRR